MGILEDTYGPEVAQMMVQYGSISPEAKSKAKNDALMNAGFAMLASNGMGATRNQSLGRALGAGGLAGVNTYNNSLEDAQKQQYGQLQMAGQMEKLVGQRNKQKQMAQYRNALDPKDQMQFDVDPEGYLKRKYESYNLGAGEKRFSGGVEVASGGPKLPDGFILGPDGKMMVDPAYEAFKMKHAAAGKPSIENKIYNTAETEQAKVWGKTLGEVRSNFANAAFTAPSKLAKLDRMEQLLQGVEGGKLSPLGLEIASAANSIGLKIDPKLGNKQASESLAREMAAEFRQPGTGPMTDKDFDNFMKRVPDLSKTTEGRAEIFKTMRAATARDVGAYKIISDYAKKRNGNIDDGVMDELSGFYAQNPVVNKPSGGWSATVVK